MLGPRSADRRLDTLLTLTRPRLATFQGTICATSISIPYRHILRSQSGTNLAHSSSQAREEHSAGVPLMFLGSGEEETEMDVNYVFLCGVMWCRFGQQDAGKELLRATNSVDPDMKALAWAMLAKGARRLRDLERPTPTGSRGILEGNLCG